MRRSFYKKLMASYLVVITVVFSAGMIYLHFGLSAQLMEQAEENLARNARLARRQLVSSISANPQSDHTNAIAEEIGRALGVRVTVISASGELLADSDPRARWSRANPKAAPTGPKSSRRKRRG